MADCRTCKYRNVPHSKEQVEYCKKCLKTKRYKGTKV